ncbi:nucleotidyltransferase domain-containing protein [Streptomyces sp. NPDC004031]
MTTTTTTTGAAAAAGGTARALDELAAAHRPEQLVLLEQLMGALTASRAVTHLMVRGSLAGGRVDRLSDLDLVVAVADGQLPTLLTVLDPLMHGAHGALLPGWPDTIVGQLGGAGRVYLLPYGGHLLQLDLYLCPASAAEALRARTGARVLWQATDAGAPSRDDRSAAARALAADGAAAAAPDARGLLVQAVVLHAMLRKRIARGQRRIAYGLHHQLTETLRDVIRTVLVPHSRHHGWYHLHEIGNTATGRACLRALDDALAQPAVPTLEQADQALDRIVLTIARIAPAASHGLADQLTAYRAYQDLETDR